MQKIFLFANIGLCAYFLVNGILLYAENINALDAGVIPLFLAAWFGLAAFGIYKKNAWMVTMACLALICFEILALFIQGLGIIHSGLIFSPTDQQAVMIASGIIGFAIACQIYAIWIHLRIGNE